MSDSKRLKLVACEVMYRELCAVVARSPHQIDVEFLTKGLHDLGGTKMKDRIQEVLDRVDGGCYQAILLGYALCGNGLAGLETRTLPFVAPRAHDCIALLMGSRHRFQEYFSRNPGTYYRSTGWLERGKGLKQLNFGGSELGAELKYEDLVAKYGEDNARYLYEEFTRYRQNYQKLAFIRTGLEPDGRFEEQAHLEAKQHAWEFEKVEGDLSLLERLVNGDWSGDDFLVVPPGHRIAPTYDDGIIRADKLTP